MNAPTHQPAPQQRPCSAPLQFKVADDGGDDGRIEGYGAIFDEADYGGDVILPGAFAKSLRERPRAKLLWQHDPTKVLGVWDEVSEDARGLRVRGRLLMDVALAREAHALLRAGALDGLSIGYRAVKADRVSGRRVLQEIDLWEVSVVTFAMMPLAKIDDVKACAADEVKTALHDGDDVRLKRVLERVLRDEAGLSVKGAKALLADGVKGLTGARDADRQLHDLAAHIAAARNTH